MLKEAINLFKYIDSLLNKKQKEQIRAIEYDRLIEQHFTFGLFVRNNILHPINSANNNILGFNIDDLSGTIIAYYWKYLNNISFSKNEFINELKRDLLYITESEKDAAVSKLINVSSID